MQIQKRTLNWLPRPSLYNEAQALREKQKAAHQEFLSSQSNLANTIGSIQSDYSAGLGKLVGNIAAARIGMKTVA
jgi:hypothetical protein